MRSCWGRGHATEASRGLIEYGFQELGVDEVFARTMRANRASQAVMEKCGLASSREYIEDRYLGADKRAVENSRTR